MPATIATCRSIARIVIEEAGPKAAKEIIRRITLETLPNAATNKSYATTLDGIVTCLYNELERRGET